MVILLGYTIGLGLCLGVALMNLPPALDVLMAQYHLDHLGISVLITSLLWAHALFLLPGGMIADRWGTKPTLVWGLFLLALGNLTPFASQAMVPAVMGRIVCGVGTGLSYAAAMKILALATPPHRSGVYQAYLGGSVALGSILSFLVLPAMSQWDWRWPFALPAAMSGLCLVLLLPLPIARGADCKKSSVTLGLLAILAMPQAWVLGMLHGLSWGSVMGLGNWTPSLLAEARGASSTSFLAWTGALVMLTSGLGRIGGAPLLARFRPARVAGTSMLILAAVYLAMVLSQGFDWRLFWVMAAVSLASVNFGSIFQMASRATGAGDLGGLLGFVNLLANVGAICFVMLLGWFKEQSGSFGMSLAVFSLACLVVGLVTIWSYRDLPPES